MSNYYDFLQVSPSASQEEINRALDRQYDHWRRLVIHHEQAVVEQANQSLRLLEQIRNTLTTPAARDAYDAGLGIKGTVAGLTDPGSAMRFGPGRALQDKSSRLVSTKVAQLTVDAWVCEKCKTQNRIGLKFCAHCGERLGINCPNCGELIKVSDVFCPECGKKLEESKAQAQERAVVTEWIDQTKREFLQMKYVPTVRAVIAKGPFQEVYRVCFETMSSYKAKQLGFTFPVKNVTTNPQIGEVQGEIGNAASWPKSYKLRVCVQNNNLDGRGVVFVVTTNYAQLDITGSGLSFFADPFIQLLMARSDLFVEKY